MDIKKFINDLLSKKADFSDLPAEFSPPIPPSTGDAGAIQSPVSTTPSVTPTPAQNIPSSTRKVYPTEFKKWAKFKGYRNGQKFFDTLGYFINISEVDPNSPDGQELTSMGYKYDASRKTFAKMMKLESEFQNIKKELAKIEAQTGSVFDKKWEQQALEVFPDIGEQEAEPGSGDLVSSGEEATVEGILGGTLSNERKKEVTDKYVRSKIEDLAKLTEEARAEILKEMLAVHEGFHNYSFINRILMMLQKNDVSSFVAGKGSWENPNGLLKRKVKEGEKPLDIFAPEQYKIFAGSAKKIMEALDAYMLKVGKIKIRDSEFVANEIGLKDFYSKHFLGYAFYMGRNFLDKTIEWIEKQLKSPSVQLYKAIYYGSKKNAFKMVQVYDVSQTEATEPDSFNPDQYHEKMLGPNAPDDRAIPLLNAAIDWAKTSARYQIGNDWKTGIQIDMAKEMGSSVGGWSEHSGDIAINRMSQGWRQLATVIHEIAHTLLHWGPDRGQITKSQREIEAEATVYIVLDYYGYQDTKFVANYLNLHATTGQDVLDRYERIDKASRMIIKGMEDTIGKKVAHGSWFNIIKYSLLGVNRKLI